MTKIVIFIFLIITNLSFCQNKRDSILDYYNELERKELQLKDFKEMQFDKFYRIWVSNYQVIELVKTNDTLFDGYLINSVTETRKKTQKKILQKIKISDRIVKKLISKLQNENVETLKDCYEFKNYPQGFDGKSYTFEIASRNERRIYSYWEPESFQNLDIADLKNVQNIIKAINTEFNLWKYFEKFRDRLPPGNYTYGGIHIVKF